MALDSFCQKEHQTRDFVEGNGNLAVGLKLHSKSSSDYLNRSLTNVIARDVYTISVLPEEDENANCASPIAFLNILEVPNHVKSPMCLDAHLNCQNCIDFQMKSEDVCSQCIIDIPSVNGNSVSPESYEEAVESFKTGNSPTSVLWRESSFKGGKLMHSPVNVNNPREKPVSEKLHDLPSNRWRRYKRAASFDSKKVALLFSILSSFGTLVLIYLTLRVRQRADGFALI